MRSVSINAWLGFAIQSFDEPIVWPHDPNFPEAELAYRGRVSLFERLNGDWQGMSWDPSRVEGEDQSTAQLRRDSAVGCLFLDGCE